MPDSRVIAYHLNQVMQVNEYWQKNPEAKNCIDKTVVGAQNLEKSIIDQAPEKARSIFNTLFKRPFYSPPE
jgi:hypothetical protein